MVSLSFRGDTIQRYSWALQTNWLIACIFFDTLNGSQLQQRGVGYPFDLMECDS